MNFITAIALAITIVWSLQCNVIADALVNTRRGKVQSEAALLDDTTVSYASRSKSGKQFPTENEIGRSDTSGDSYLNSAKVIRLVLDQRIDPTRVSSTSATRRESTTTARPSQGQIPRPAMVSRQDQRVSVY